MRSSGLARSVVVVGVVVGLAGCAASVPPPPVVTTPRFPNFVFPTVPSQYQASPAATSHERAWLFLQAGDLGEARRGFGDTLQQQAGFYPSAAGLGYVELAERSYDAAVARFGEALAADPSYVPALVGRGEALLAGENVIAALESFEAALAVDPGLEAVQRRVQVLRFRGLQAYVEAARAADAANRLGEARRNYERAMEASPESALLHRELADLERRDGALAEAASHARRATELDPSDAAAYVVLGDVETARGAFDEAVAAYERARAIDPSVGVETRLERARENAEYARLPAQYRAIAAANRVSRGALAALIGVQLQGLLESSAGGGARVITDSRDHWAAPWIIATAGAGVMEVYPNHTFLPDESVRRGDLGRVASRVLEMIARRDPARARRWMQARIEFPDLAPGHLSYPAASRAVAAGVLSVAADGRFNLTAPVSGAEAIAAVERLEALAEEADRRVDRE